MTTRLLLLTDMTSLPAHSVTNADDQAGMFHITSRGFILTNPFRLVVPIFQNKVFNALAPELATLWWCMQFRSALLRHVAAVHATKPASAARKLDALTHATALMTLRTDKFVPLTLFLCPLPCLHPLCCDKPPGGQTLPLHLRALQPLIVTHAGWQAGRLLLQHPPKNTPIVTARAPSRGWCMHLLPR